MKASPERTEWHSRVSQGYFFHGQKAWGLIQLVSTLDFPGCTRVVVRWMSLEYFFNFWCPVVQKKSLYAKQHYCNERRRSKQGSCVLFKHPLKPPSALVPNQFPESVETSLLCLDGWRRCISLKSAFSCSKVAGGRVCLYAKLEAYLEHFDYLIVLDGNQEVRKVVMMCWLLLQTFVTSETKDGVPLMKSHLDIENSPETN